MPIVSALSFSIVGSHVSESRRGIRLSPGHSLFLVSVLSQLVSVSTLEPNWTECCKNEGCERGRRLAWRWKGDGMTDNWEGGARNRATPGR